MNHAPAGAQPERTTVAWQRTVLAWTVSFALLVKHPAGGVAADIAAFATLMILVVTAGRRRSILADEPAPSMCSPVLIAVVAGGTASLGVLAIAASWWGTPS